MEIEDYSRFIVSKYGQYLVCVNESTKAADWRPNIYDAWWTVDINAAKKVARILGGRVVKFNPIIGRIISHE